MDADALDRILREAVQDFRLDAGEKLDLREIGQQLDAGRIRFLRNRAFDIVREALLRDPGESLAALHWLEQVIKTLDAANETAPVVSSAYFSPGESCLRRLADLMRGCRTSLDICVFTIADDRLSDNCWEQAPAANTYYEYWKSNPALSPLKTEFRMLYDARGIYIKITNFDDHLDKIRASIVRRDDPSLWTDDSATLYFDPQANGVGFTSFTVNSTGVVSDFKQQDAAVKLNDWSGTDWRAVTHKDKNSWIIEAFFPWTDLGKKASAGDVWMFDHVRYAFTSGKFVGATWAAGGNYQSTSNFGYLYFVKNEKLSPDAVAKILESAAPAPWMLPLDTTILVHPQPGEMQFTNANAMATSRQSSLQQALTRAKDASKSDTVAQKQLVEIETKADGISFQDPAGSLEAVDKMAALQQQADQIYWQQQLNNLIEQSAETLRR